MHQNYSLQMRVQDIFLACAELGNENNRRKTLFILVAVVGVGGITALFSTASSTCSKVSLENKTGESIFIYNVSPYGAKVKPTYLLPYSKTTITFSSWSNYANLDTTAGRMHFLKNGEGTLEDGASNKAIADGSPHIFFWVCNQNYISVPSPSSNVSASADWTTSYTSYAKQLVNLFPDMPSGPYLRGAADAQTQMVKYESTFSLSKSIQSFFKAQEQENPFQKDEISLIFST